jgi:hypothetical protein
VYSFFILVLFHSNKKAAFTAFYSLIIHQCQAKVKHQLLHPLPQRPNSSPEKQGASEFSIAEGGLHNSI